MRIRPYRPGDEDALVDLYARVFGQKHSTDWWRWKLLGRPGAIDRAAIGETDGDLVFQIGGIPCQAVLDGSDATIVVAVDAMTRPHHRRRGLLTRGSGWIFERWRTQGVHLVLGLPNEQHGSSTAAVGWLPLVRLEWRVRLLRPERVLARRLGLRWLDRLSVAGRIWSALWGSGDRTDVALDERPPDAKELDALWNRCRPDVRHGLVRNAAWIHWRYLDAPHTSYNLLAARRAGHLEGLLCYRVRRQEQRTVVFVAEALVPSNAPGVERALFRGVADRAREHGAEFVATLSLRGTRRAHILRELGYLRAWGAFDVHGVPLASGVSVEGLRDPRAWSLEGGAFDVV